MALTSYQTKFIAVTALVILLPIQLLFFGAMLYMVFTDDNGDKMQIIISYLFVMGIFFFPLRWAYLNWRKSSVTPDSTSSATSPDTVLAFQTSVSLHEYRNLVYQMSYSNPIFIFLHVIGLGMIASYLFSDEGSWFAFFWIFFLSYLPFGIYRNASTNYKATKAIHEPLSFVVTAENISVTGETFSSVMQWATFHKAKELKNWFLLYTNKQIAILIPKRVFASQREVDAFRELTKRIAR